ncbi:MAG: UDP-N-acetylmuramoyl-L-alanine--D-glutamate ligase [Candidatus Peregrinibacteria bacterium]|nr:UDP-N-acetylmuramoyl-L-alanine--D-glutamate ligase [Candidatus Peregrinibacteria bacterium]
MRIQDLDGKVICILGYGREGHAMLDALRTFAPTASITIADQHPPSEDPECPVQSGEHYLQKLDRFDVIIKSPGIPPKSELEGVKDRLTSATQIFFDSIAGTGATVIGVTGSKGKSTTSTLIYDILCADGRDAYLVGNIGTPAISFVGKASKNAFFVHELSSYQLMDLTVSPQIAVVTSFFPEHLDYHGSLAAYREAKAHIAHFQQLKDRIFYNAASDGARIIAEQSAGEQIPFSPTDAIVLLEETRLLGAHNESNIAAATLVARSLGIPDEVIAEAVRSFEPLPHRLQSLGIHHGIEWIDDAISTTPESAIAALDALGDRVTTIILGGQDRGNDFTGLAERIAASEVKTVILFPGSGGRIRSALEAAQCPHPPAPSPSPRLEFFDAPSMESAVAIAREHTPSGTICLLSTASPSYGMFKNFEEKGGEFRRCILGG